MASWISPPSKKVPLFFKFVAPLCCKQVKSLRVRKENIDNKPNVSLIVDPPIGNNVGMGLLTIENCPMLVKHHRC
jgi:hypothetical protein